MARTKSKDSALVPDILDDTPPQRGLPLALTNADQRVLVVATRRIPVAALPHCAGDKIVFARFDDVGAALLARFEPDLILAPLMAPEFDILDLARQLTQCGYRGALRAMARQIPNPALVRAELAQLCPDLDFDLFEVGDD